MKSLMNALTAAVLAARLHAAPLPDADISLAIKQRLLADPAAVLAPLTVQVQDGTATLAGTVDNVLARDRAGRIAASVRGVRLVANDIVVQPPTRPNVELVRDVEAALRAESATDHHAVAVQVDDGYVTLTANVDSYPEKRLALMAARGVRGVKEVRDQIRVIARQQRPDSEITAEVKGIIDADVWVDGRAIEVASRDGRVRLSGRVGSLAEKVRATAQAWVPGVEAVEAEGLTVEPQLTDDMRRQPHFNPTSAEIERALRAALRRNPRVAASNIDVEVTGSVVSLSGRVDTVRARRTAERLARSLVGVSTVRNELRLHPEAPELNANLAEAVRAAFARDAMLADDEIAVSTGAGIVKLGGKVDSAYEKELAEDIVAGIKGVVTVANSLEVASPKGAEFEEGFDFESDSGGITIERIHPPAPLGGDDAIRAAIERELRFSPFVRSSRINVHVQDGIATLTGIVASHHALQAAIANAREGGAIDVRSNLHVETVDADVP